MAKKKPTGTENGRAVIEQAPAIPNALGSRRRVEMVVEQLLSLQQQAFELDIIQTANGRSDDDPVDGMEADENGHTPTYGERRTMFRGAEERIADAYPDLMPQVQAYLDGIRAAELAQAEAQ